MRTVVATRYVTAMREGGSLPGLMEADDLGMYVVKFTGAGQGPRALVAEVICAGLGRVAGLAIPETVRIVVDPELALGEPDEEIQALLRASPGLNLGVDYLPGALDVPPGAQVDPLLAGRIVWFDALVANRDRSWRNPNLLAWHGRIHPIDHGAALAFHHAWRPGAPLQPRAGADKSYSVDDHVFRGTGAEVLAADVELAGRFAEDLVTEVVAEVPDEWLADLSGVGEPRVLRAAYVDWLVARLANRASWVPGVAREIATPASRPLAAPGRPAWLARSPRPGARP